MTVNIIDIKCPNCGAPQNISSKECMYCNSPVTITTFRSMSGLTNVQVKKYLDSYKSLSNQDQETLEVSLSIAFCFMKTKNYLEAIKYFDKVLIYDFDNADLYFYKAICLLEGKRPFLHKKANIDLIENELVNATQISNKGIYYFLWKYIIIDYYQRKFFRPSIHSLSELDDLINKYEVSLNDKEELKQLLGKGD